MSIQLLVRSFAIPPDEPIGKMNQCWPSGINYSTLACEDDIGDVALSIPLRTGVEEPESGSSRRSSHDSSQLTSSQTENLEKPIESRPSINTNQSFEPVQRDVLHSNEFRLVCLTPVDDFNFPVHVSLETYRHDNCPEYETVSYTW